MNKIDLHPPLTYPSKASSVVSALPSALADKSLGTAHRLLVLVPEDTNHGAAARRIWELVHATSLPVRLLGLCKSATEEPSLRRGLVTMASLLQDERIPVETSVNTGTDWMDIVKNHYQTGDMIVCFAEQRTGLLRRPLSQILESNLKAPVYILSSLTAQQTKRSTLAQVSAWLGFMTIIVGFGILQVNLVRLSEGWLQNFLLIASLIPEFWLICVWHGRFR